MIVKLKKLLKILIPVLIGLGLAGVIIVSYLFLIPGSLTSEKAVTGFINASLKQDVNDMVRYASDYQKVKLYGNKNYTNSALKEKLKKSYSDVQNIYSNSSITFSVESKTDLDSNSEEYKKFSDEYTQVTGKSNISGISIITVKVFVDGKQYQKQSVYAVKSGISWYYGY